MRRGGLLAALAAAALLGGLAAAPVHAGTGGPIAPTDPGSGPQRYFRITVSSPGQPAVEASLPSNGGPPPVCVWGYASGPVELEAERVAYGPKHQEIDPVSWPVPNHLADEGKGLFYQPSCVSTSSDADIGAEIAWLQSHPEFIWVPTAGPFPPDLVTPAELAAIAAANIRVPDVTIHTSPTGTAYTKLPTAVWADSPPASTLTATASLDGGEAPVQSETVTASIDHLRLLAPSATLTPGDGACAGTGTPYSSGSGGEPSCAITWTTSSGGQPDQAFHATVQVVWTVTWTTGTIGGTTIPQALVRVVKEIDSLNVGG